MKAADIPDRDFVAAVAEIQRIGGSWATWSRDPDYNNGEGGIIHRFPGVPYKVLLAKSRRVLKRGLVTGCGCGCRGDFEVTTKGQEILRS